MFNGLFLTNRQLGSSYPSQRPAITSVLGSTPPNLYIDTTSDPGITLVQLEGQVVNDAIATNEENGLEFELYERAIIQVTWDGILEVDNSYTLSTPLVAAPLFTSFNILGHSPDPDTISQRANIDFSTVEASIIYVVGYKFLTQTHFVIQNTLQLCPILNRVYSTSV